MSFLDKFSAHLGKAVGSFERGRAEANTLPKRPFFMSASASNTRWEGTNLADTEAAAKRAVQNSWLFTAINLIAGETSAAELQVVKHATVGEEAVDIPNHHFETILRHPNPYMGRAFLWRYTTFWLELAGDAYWFLTLDSSGRLAELWPLPAHKMRPVAGDAQRFVDYYEYMLDGNPYKIPAETICHFRLPNPFSLYTGFSPLNAALLPVENDLAMGKWNWKFFDKDNVMPSAIINLSSGDANTQIDPSDVERIKEDLQSGYSASRRRTAITTAHTLDVEVLGWSAREMDFLAGRAFSKEEIYSIYGIPPGLMNANATEANANTADRVFKEKTIWPLLALFAEQITAQVIDRFYGWEYEARFKDIRPTNRALELQEMDRAVGILTVDEMRMRYFGLKPVNQSLITPPNSSEGSSLSQSTNKPVETLPSNLAGTQPTAIYRNIGLDPTQPSKGYLIDLSNWQSKALKALKQGKSPVVRFSSGTIPADMANDISRQLTTLPENATTSDIFHIFTKARREKDFQIPWMEYEIRYAEAISREFKRYTADLLKVVEGGEDIMNNSDIWRIHRQNLEELSVENVKKLSVFAVLECGNYRNRVKTIHFPPDWAAYANDAAAWAVLHINDIIGKVVQTTRKEVQAMLDQWYANKGSQNDLIDLLRNKDGKGNHPFSYERAQMIAQTECTNIFAQSQASTLVQLGCTPAVILPALHVNCRCYVMPETLPNGQDVFVWYTALSDRTCARTVSTPFGTMNGCRDLHGRVVSEGTWMGSKITDI